MSKLVLAGIVLVCITAVGAAVFLVRRDSRDEAKKPVVQTTSAKTVQKERVLIDLMKTLRDGESKLWEIPVGTYRVEFRASGDGARLRWTGDTNCKESKAQQFKTTCSVRGMAHLRVLNPRALGKGAPTTVSMHIVELLSQVSL